MINFKTILSRTVGSRNSLPAPVLFLPGLMMIALGCLVWLARDLFVFLISSVLVALGVVMLVMAWRMRPKPPRIRVLDSDDPL